MAQLGTRTAAPLHRRRRRAASAAPRRAIRGTHPPRHAAPAPFARFRAPLRHRDLRRLVAAYVVGMCGTWSASVVLTAWVFERTGSLVWLAALASTRWIPGLLAAPFAGVVADRFDRRTVLIASAGTNALVVLAVAVVVAADAPPGVALGLLAFSALATSPYRPAAGALTPDVVGEDELPTANALLAAVENLVVVVGPAIGAALLLLDAPAVGVAAGALGSAAAAVLAASLRVRSRGAGARGGAALRQVARAVVAVRAAPTALVLIAVAAADTLLAWAYGVVYVPLAQHLRLGDGGYGLLLVAAAVGGIAGAFAADRLSRLRRVSPVIAAAILAQALPYALTAFTRVAVIGVGLQVVSGAGMVVVEVLTLVAVQREVPAGRLSGVLGLLDLVILAASAVGGFIASGVLGALRIPAALLVLGLGDALIGIALMPLLLRTERRAERRTAALADRVALLERLPLFADASRRRLEALSAVAVRQQLPSGARLMRPGDRPNAVWILVEGTLLAGAQVVMAPEVVGELGVLHGLPRTEAVVARTPSTLWRIAADDYLDSLTSRRVPRLLLGTPSVRHDAA